jgi:uncharacterized membrane protein
MDNAVPLPTPKPSLRARWEALQPFRTAALIGAVPLVLIAQALTDKRLQTLVALALFVVAGVLYAFGAATQAQERPLAGVLPARLRLHLKRLLWALLLGGLAFAAFGGNRLSAPGLLAWGAGMITFLAALPDREATATAESLWARARAAVGMGRWRLSWSGVVLIVALLLSIFFEFYQLDTLPADLGWDVPYNYFDAQRILRGENLIFFTDNYGREGMFFYIIAGVASLIKLSPLAMRAASALVGLAAIPAIYLLAKEIADDETAAYAALLLAVNKWHLTLMRSGFRVSLFPLFCILMIYTLARALRRGHPRDWGWAGLVVGLGMWTYKAFSFAVATAIGCVVVYALLSWREQWLAKRRAESAAPGHADRRVAPGHADRRVAPLTRWGAPPQAIMAGMGIMLLGAVLGAVPMARFAVEMPKVWLAREMLSQDLMARNLQNRGSYIENLARNTLTSVLMFNYEGDGNTRFGVPFQRHFGYITAALLVLGVAGALARFRQGGNALLLLATAGLILPMTVSMFPGEKPNCFRAAGTIGPGLVLAALALRTLRGRLATVAREANFGSLNLEVNTASGELRRVRIVKFGFRMAFLPLLIVALFMLAETRETWRFYFTDFRLVTADKANWSVSLELAKSIIDYQDGPTYIKTWPYWYDGRGVRVHLVTANRAWTGELQELAVDKPPLAGFRGKMMVLLHPQDKAGLAVLQGYFPRSTTVVKHFPDKEPAIVAFYGEKP